MKPIRIVMSAFGSYAGKETVSFETVQHGIFLITGDTGAGKTTIFDAVTFALYGESSGAKREASMMRSHLASVDCETYVELEFEERGERYRIYRKPSYYRPGKKRGKDGTYGRVFSGSKVSFFLPDGSEMPGKISDINRAIQELIGVDRNQFAQIAMIAQGEYLKLLHATSKERKEIFSRIFHTDIYWKIQQRLKEKDQKLYGELADSRKAEQREKERIICEKASEQSTRWEEICREGVSDPETVAGVLKEILSEIDSNRVKLEQREQKIHQKIIELEKQRAQIQRINGLLSQREAAEVAAQKLRDKQVFWQDQEERLTAGKRAQRVENGEKILLDKMEQLQQCRNQILQMESDLKVQRERERETEKCWRESEMVMRLEVPAWRETLLKLEENMSQYREVSVRKKELEKIRGEVEKVKETYHKQEEEGKRKKEQLERLREEEKELKDSSVELVKKQQEVQNQRQRLEKLAQIQAQYLEWADGKQKLTEYQKELVRKTAAVEQAWETYKDKNLRLIAAQAGILAEVLQEGQPCPVCGSLSHPKKAVMTEDTVTKQQVEEANSRFQREQQALQRTAAVCENLKGVCESRKKILQRDGAALLGNGFLPFLDRSEPDPLAAETIEKYLAKKKEQLRQAEQEQKTAEQKQVHFEKIRKRREDLEKNQEEHRISQESRYRLWKEHEAQLEGKRLALQDICAKLSFESEEAAKDQMQHLERKIRDTEERERTARQDYENAVRAEKQLLGSERALKLRKEELVKESAEKASVWKALLSEQGFYTETEYRRAAMGLIEIEELEHQTAEFRNQLMEAEIKERQLQEQTEGMDWQDEGSTLQILNELQAESLEVQKERTNVAAMYNQNLDAAGRLKKIYGERAELGRRYQVVNTLYRTANGKLSGTAGVDFQTYVQRQYFKRMIQAANRRLLRMTDQQFKLQCREMDELGKQGEVGLDLDVYSVVTDKVRDVKTLSGGESFLAALSMALGMADVIQKTAGRIHVDTLFIDEGFGSLDEISRGKAIQVLQDLAGENRLIGIISHVTELKEQMGRKLIVEKTEKGSRVHWELDE